MGIYKKTENDIVYECETPEEFIDRYYNKESEFLELSFKEEEKYQELYEIVKENANYRLLSAEFYAYGKVVEENNIKFFDILKELKEKKDKRAIFYLGIALMNGEGIDQDEKEGLKLLNKASDLGYSIADYQLCIYYANHYAISKVAKYKNQLKLKGSPKAQYMLAISLMEANNYQDAFTYMLLAAKRGYVPAYEEVSIMYRDGLGTKKRQEESALWMEKHKNSGYPDKNAE